MTLTPLDIIAEAIAKTEDGRYTRLLVDHSLRSRKLIAQHALDALSEAGYTVVPTARLDGARAVADNFLSEYGYSRLPMFKVAQDLANSIRKRLDGKPDDL